MNQKTAWRGLPLAIIVTVVALAPAQSRDLDYELPDPVFPLPIFHERTTGGGFSIVGGHLIIHPSCDEAVNDTGRFSQVIDSIRNVINWSWLLPDFNECVESWRTTAMLGWSRANKDEMRSARTIVGEAEPPFRARIESSAICNCPQKAVIGTRPQGALEGGIPPLLLEIQGPGDSVPVGTDITFSIRISNTGAKSLTDIVLISPIPASLEFKKAEGPSHFHLIKREIIFDALPILRPKSDVYYEVVFRSIREGDVWFNARVRSLHSEDFEREMEHTKVIPKH